MEFWVENDISTEELEWRKRFGNKSVSYFVTIYVLIQQNLSVIFSKRINQSLRQC